MSNSEYHRLYYQTHREEITAMRKSKYGLKILNEFLAKLDVQEQVRLITESLLTWDPDDKSYENIEFRNLTILWGQVLFTLHHMASPKEEQEKWKHSLKWIQSVPMIPLPERPNPV